MQKPLPIQITIPEPCHQIWDEMTLSGNGRFCAHCSKTVVDFSTWSDAQLCNFFAKNTGSVCGRFYATQLNRAIAIPYQPHSRLYRMTVALGLTLLVAQAPQAVAQYRAPLVTQTDTMRMAKPQQGNDGFGVLKGKVVDENKEGMINAVVQVLQNGIVKGGCITDIDGNYTIQPLDAGEYEAIFLYLGYDTIKVKSVLIRVLETTTVNFAAQKPKNSHFLGLTTYAIWEPTMIDHDNPGKRSFSKQDIDNMTK